MTGATKALTDPTPAINPQQAEYDRRRFMELHANTAPAAMRRDNWIDQARGLRDAGWSDTAIARELHHSRHMIVRHLGPPEYKHRWMPKHERERKINRAIEMWADGHTKAEIARTVGVRYQTVQGWFKARGIK